MLRALLLVVAMNGIVDLDDGWQYALSAPGAPAPVAASAWHEELDHDPARDLWYRIPLPANAPTDARLVFRSYLGAFELYVGQQQVYAFDEPAARGRLRLHDVALPQGAAGAQLLVRVPRGERPPLFGGSPSLTSGGAVPRALVHAAAQPFRDDLLDLVLGTILTILGIICVAVSRVRRRGQAEGLLWFGVFAALYGVRLLLNTYVPALLGLPVREVAFAEAWITYGITVPGWMLCRAFIGNGWRGSLRWQVYAFAAFAPIGVATDLVTGQPESLAVVNNVLVITGGVNVLLNLVLAAPRKTLELRVVLAGAVVFMLAALNNNLAAVGLLPWPQGDETLGFIAFVSALGFAATRGFVRGERERLAIEGELATAREIQRSILPTQMPSIPGLRFSARYDPASSVAGDLYDFVAVDDASAGVLVADVAGHGVPAALIASMVKIAVSSQSQLGHYPAAMLGQLNRTLKREVRRAFVTATFLHLDMQARTVTVANAGHAPPLLLRDGAFQELGPTGILLGRFPAAQYVAGTVALRAGDRIVAWTDGIVEARNARGEAFGEERLQELVRRGGNVADSVVDAVHAWRNADDDADDLTIVVIEVIEVERT